MKSIQQLLGTAERRLNRTDARLESEYLLSEICNVSKSLQITRPDQILTAEQCLQFETAIEHRLAGVPVAYITGRRGFWDMEMHVTPDVLIPRPDTECLVDQALLKIPVNAAWKIADLGTGSGAVVLAIARERRQCCLTATDISVAALAIARKNVQQYGVANIRFVAGSWMQPFGSGKFDMIVSNPPYIRTGDPHLRQGDLPAEPQLALVAGADGLQAIRQIIHDCRRNLKDGGYLLLEHGFDQAQAVRELMEPAGFTSIFNQQDYSGNDRVTGGRLKI